jgi:hypothetical protein
MRTTYLGNGEQVVENIRCALNELRRERLQRRRALVVARQGRRMLRGATNAPRAGGIKIMANSTGC